MKTDEQNNERDIVDILDEIAATLYYNHKISDSIMSEASRTIRNLRETVDGLIAYNDELRDQIHILKQRLPVNHRNISRPDDTYFQREAN